MSEEKRVVGGPAWENRFMDYVLQVLQARYQTSLMQAAKDERT